MLNTPPPPPVQQPMYNYPGYSGYPQYQAGYYPGQYPQGYGNYMGQPNPYMNNSYTQQIYQTTPQNIYPNYMQQTNTGYMNQTLPQQQQNNQQRYNPNPYNSYKK